MKKIKIRSFKEMTSFLAVMGECHSLWKHVDLSSLNVTVTLPLTPKDSGHDLWVEKYIRFLKPLLGVEIEVPQCKIVCRRCRPHGIRREKAFKLREHSTKHKEGYIRIPSTKAKRAHGGGRAKIVPVTIEKHIACIDGVTFSCSASARGIRRKGTRIYFSRPLTSPPWKQYGTKLWREGTNGLPVQQDDSFLKVELRLDFTEVLKTAIMRLPPNYITICVLLLIVLTAGYKYYDRYEEGLEAQRRFEIEKMEFETMKKAIDSLEWHDERLAEQRMKPKEQLRQELLRRLDRLVEEKVLARVLTLR